MCNPLNILVSKLRKKVSSNVLHIQFLSFFLSLFAWWKIKIATLELEVLRDRCEPEWPDWAIPIYFRYPWHEYHCCMFLPRYLDYWQFLHLLEGFLDGMWIFIVACEKFFFDGSLPWCAILWSSLVMWGRRKMCSLTFVDITTSYFYW